MTKSNHQIQKYVSRLNGTQVSEIDMMPKKGIPEIKIQYKLTGTLFDSKITSSRDTFDLLKSIFDEDTIQVQESFIILYLNRANKILGYYKHSIGGIAGTVADPRLIFAIGVISACSGIILSHNHPSGNLTPSQPDIILTNRIKDAGKLLDIQLLDHLIMAKSANQAFTYYSFADEGMI